jgi:hypothetical protein
MATTLGVEVELADITNNIKSLLEQGNAAAHQIGTLYNQVVDRRLAIIAGYPDTRSYFAEHIKALAQSTLSLYGRVARLFSVAVCASYGPYKLQAIVTYADAAGYSMGSDPTGVPVDVPQDNGSVVTKPFAACTMEEIERAIKAKKAPPKVRVPVTDRARLLFVEDSIFRKFQGSGDVRLTSRMDGGQTLISVQDVPVTKLAQLVEALQEGMNAEPTLTADAGGMQPSLHVA